MSTSLRVSREGRLLRLTLNRPEKRNALDFALCRDLVDAIKGAERDAGCGAVLLDAEGPSFCAGMDLEEALAPDAAGKSEVHERLFTAGARLSKPLVAAVHGAALGGGTGLVANAHIVVASEDATFGLTEVRLGLWPYVVFRAMKLAVGERRALELSLTGRIATAAEAREWGLVHHVVARAELPSRALEIATAVAAWSTGAVSQGLEFVHRTCERPSDAAGRLAFDYRARAFASEDFRQAASAFLEKRKP